MFKFHNVVIDVGIDGRMDGWIDGLNNRKSHVVAWSAAAVGVTGRF